MKEYPNRKANRLKNYNYSQDGAYFITICVKDKHNILGEIVVGDAALGVPSVHLTETGEMVKQHIEQINNVYEYVRLDKYIIMPNHIHLIVSITNETQHTTSGMPNRSGSGTPRAASPTKAIIPQIVNALKSLTSKNFGGSIWQRSYHDHIIRNEAEYQKIWEYIDTNPIRWEMDEYHI